VRRLAAAVLLGCAWPSLLVAQAPAAGRLEIAAGVRWIGSENFSSTPSEQLKNGGTTRTVFRSASELSASPAVDGRLGVAVTPRLQFEAAFVFDPTQFSTRLIGDVEGIPDTVATTPLRRYVIEGGARLQLRRLQRRRVMPFVAAGAGYVRNVSQGQLLVETGQTYYFGGGADVPWRPGGARGLRGGGLRFDARATLWRGGFAADRPVGVAPMLAASIYARF
jgi:hypothetical protein